MRVLALACAVGLLGGVGCTKFTPRAEPDAEFGVDVPVIDDALEAVDTDASTDVEVVSPPDSGPETTEPEDVADADGTVDTEPGPVDVSLDADPVDGVSSDADEGDVSDGGPDLDGGLEDAPEPPDDVPQPDGDAPGLDGVSEVVSCPEPCSTPGGLRCALTGEPTVEVCQADPATGCVVWMLQTVCPSSACEGEATCVGGECGTDTTQAVVCVSDDPCTLSTCDPATGDCIEGPAPTEGSCDDGDFCTVLDKCDPDGVCVGSPNAAGCPCGVDLDCVQYEPDSDLCDGRYRCTDLGWASEVTACVFEPEPVVCVNDDPTGCTTPQCVAAIGACTAVPVAEGTLCDDGDACSGTSTCQLGQCQGDNWVQCEQEAPCDDVQCNPDIGLCEWVGLDDDCCGNGILEQGEVCDTPASWCDSSCDMTDCVPGSLGLGPGCLLVPTSAGALGDTFTVDFHLRHANVSGTILSSDFLADPGFGVALDCSWRLELIDVDGQKQIAWTETPLSGEDILVTNTHPVPEGVWTHITVVREAVAGTSLEFSLWVDGVSSGTQSFSASSLGHGDEVWFGCTGGANAGLPALIDGFRWRQGTHPPDGSEGEPPVSDADTLLLYHFDDVMPGVAVDESGWNRHGFWQGCARTDETPYAGAGPNCGDPYCHRSALLFDAAAEGVGRIQDTAAMAGVQTLTVEMHLRLDETTAGQVVVSQSDDVVGGPDWHIQTAQPAGAFVPIQWVEGQLGGFDNTVTSVVLEKDKRYHVAFVRQFDENDGTVTGRWFVDGEPGFENTLLGAMELNLAGRPIHVGSRGGSSGFMDGSIDELRISGQAMYTDEGFSPGPLEAGPATLGLYRFDVETGDWAYPELWSVLPPMVLEGVSHEAPGAVAAGPCP